MAVCQVQIVHLLFQGLPSDDRIARVALCRCASARIGNEVILLYAVAEEIEVLALGLLLRLILLQNVETLLLLK